MKNPIIITAAYVATFAFIFHQDVALAFLAGAVFVVTLVIEVRRQYKGPSKSTEKVNTIQQELQTGIVRTHLLIAEKLVNYPWGDISGDDVAKQAIEILVDAASYLSGPPPSRFVVGEDSIIDWKKKGLARLAEAQAIIDQYLATRPPSGLITP
jgi:hypothetical protein